jgi:Mce-associated membrane protein
VSDASSANDVTPPVAAAGTADADGMAGTADAAGTTERAGQESGRTGRGCLTVVVLAVVLGALVSLAAGAGKGRPPAASVAAYIRSTGAAATSVQAAASGLEAAVGKTTETPSDGSLARLGERARTAYRSIDPLGRAFATRAATGAVGDAEVEVYTARRDLAQSIAGLVAFTDDTRSATLAGVTSQFESAVGEWNDGIRVIWSAAGRAASEPTIP